MPISEARDERPEGLRHLCYTEPGTLASYRAEELLGEFHAPGAAREALRRYTRP